MHRSLKENLKTGHVICLCEGTAEEIVIKKLFDENKLVFKKGDFFEDEELLRIFTRIRKGSNLAKEFLNQDYGDRPINILRILDSKTEKFILGKVYNKRIESGGIKIFNILTRPEIEILMIVNEKHYSKFTNKRGKEKASEYCKRVFDVNNVKSEKFLSDYYEDVEVLMNAIENYEKLHSKEKDEIRLNDILD